MSSALPAQLKWRDFVYVLKKLGYEECSSKGGSARNFKTSAPGRPPIVTFHEPHGSSTLRQGTLREYIRKLEISRDDFLRLLSS